MADDLFSFEDQVVLVTGSSSGIGAAVARAAARQGARVVVNSRSSLTEGQALADELAGALYIQADVSQEEEAKRLIATTVAELGRLDHLVNNAGTTKVIPHHDFDALTDDVWRTILDVNLLGTFYMSRAALPHLKESRGSIVNVTSVAGVRQGGSCIPYAVSKAAINHLTKLMANQVGPEVRINAVAPGLIATPWTSDWDEAHERVSSFAPLRRSGTPEDIAAATLGLMAAPYSTGVVLLADGGLSLRS